MMVRRWSGVFGRRLVANVVVARGVEWLCYSLGLAILPMVRVALVRNSAGRIELLLGLGLAVVSALDFVMLGMLCRQLIVLQLPARLRWAEFVADFFCLAFYIGGIQWLAATAALPAQIVLGVLLISVLSLTVLVCGMLSTVIRAVRA